MHWWNVGVVFAGGLHRLVLAGGKSEHRVPASSAIAPVRTGRDYAVQEAWSKPSLARVRVVAVSLQRLGEITDDSIKREGFAGRDDYMVWWIDEYGTFDPQAHVWAVVFMLVESPLLLAKDSSHGYTHDTRLALDHEPEAVNPEEIPHYTASVEARTRFELMHSERLARQQLRPQLDRLRRAGISTIKAGRDPGDVLEAAAIQLEGKG